MTERIRFPNYGLKFGDLIIKTSGEVLAFVAEVLDKDTVKLSTEGKISTFRDVGIELGKVKTIFLPEDGDDKRNNNL